MYKRTVLFILIVPLLFGTACRDSQEQQAKQQAAEAQANLKEELQSFRTEMQADLSTINRTLDTLETHIQAADADAQAEMHKTLTALQARHDKLLQDVQHIGNTSYAEYRRQHEHLEQRLLKLEAELEATRLHSIEARDAFQQAVHDRLNDVESAIETLDQQVQQVDASTQGEYSETIAALRQQHQTLTQRYEEVQSASEEEFRELRQALADDVAQLGTDVRAATNEVKRALNPDVSERS